MPTNSGFLAGVLAMCLSREDTKSIALVLSQLDPLLSAGVLSRLPEEMQLEVIFHLASGKFDARQSPEINAILLDGILNDAGGPKAVADIINLTGASVEKRLLDNLDARDPHMAEAGGTGHFRVGLHLRQCTVFTWAKTGSCQTRSTSRG